MALDVYKDWLGIPEGPRPPGHYELLRLVQFEDDAEKVRAHYKKLNLHVRKYASGQYSVQSQDLLNELAKSMLLLTDPERKREYDESLGREFEDDDEGPKTTEAVLVAQKHISRAQAKELVEFADARGLSTRDAVVQMKLVDVATATSAYAEELGFSYVDLEDMLPEDDILDLVPRNLVKRHSILPLFIDDDVLLVACVHEPTPDLEDEIRLRYGVPMRAVLATPRSVNQAIAKYYAPGARDEAVSGTSPGLSKSGKSPVAPKKAMSQLSDAEKQERKQLGLLIMCWGVIVPILIDEFLVKSFLPAALQIPFVPSITTLLVAPAAIWWVLTVYWKK